MKIHTLITLLFLGIGNFLSAQEIASRYEIIYYTAIDKQVLEQYDGRLIFDKTSSLFDWTMTGSDALERNEYGGYKTRAVHLKNGEFNYLNKKTGNIISTAVVSNKETHYVKQEIPKINWVISIETKKIAQFECTKAVGSYKGRTYTAWFTTKIPMSYGPWKIQGLPGLILESYDRSKEVFFSLKSIKKVKIKEKVKLPKNKKYSSLKQFYQRTIDHVFEKVNRINAKSKGNVTISSTNWNFLEKDYEVLGKEVN